MSGARPGRPDGHPRAHARPLRPLDGHPAPQSRPKQPIAHALWHYARGSPPPPRAGWRWPTATARPWPGNRRHPADTSAGLNTARGILQVAQTVLTARIARARQAPDEEIALLRQAVSLQDALYYDEPADWYYPVRESLGGALLRARRYTGGGARLPGGPGEEPAQRALAVRADDVPGGGGPRRRGRPRPGAVQPRLATGRHRPHGQRPLTRRPRGLPPTGAARNATLTVTASETTI